MWKNVLNDITSKDSDHDFRLINRGNICEESKPSSNESLLNNPNPPIDHDQQLTLDQKAMQLLQVIVNVLKLPQETQSEFSERNVVNYPTFSERNQDLIEWI
ncbi:13175_t:CDS:1, partial [Cetraspora pellucida]